MDNLNVEMGGRSIPLRRSEVDEALDHLREGYGIYGGYDHHDGIGVIQRLRDGELSYDQLKRILKDISPIVLQFPDYLETLKKSVSRQDSRGEHQPVIDWLGGNVREERTHIKLWNDFISAFDIDYQESDQIQNPYIKELDGLLWDGARGDSPSVGISRLTLGVEGITGMVIKESYNGISDIYERKKGCVLSSKQKRWLNVHKNYDADVHPREAVENIAKLGILPATHEVFNQYHRDRIEIHPLGNKRDAEMKEIGKAYPRSSEVFREAQRIGMIYVDAFEHSASIQ